MTYVNLRNAVDTLPHDTVDNVAEFLRSQGITGKPELAKACPVARYLEKQVGAPVFVLGSTARFVMSGRATHLPRAVEKFVTAFDMGEYPDLIENDTRVEDAISSLESGQEAA
jgi:hypothetical protein